MIVKCLRYVFSDTAMPPPPTQFTLRVPLFVPTSNPTNGTPVSVHTTVIAESKTENTKPETASPFNNRYRDRRNVKDPRTG